MTIHAQVKTALSTLSIPVYANSLVLATGTEIPEEFCTYFLLASTPAENADDAETARLKVIQISYFNKAGLETIPDIVGLMEAAGFIRGPETELPLDEKSGHYGLAMEFDYLESEE